MRVQLSRDRKCYLNNEAGLILNLKEIKLIKSRSASMVTSTNTTVTSHPPMATSSPPTVELSPSIVAPTDESTSFQSIIYVEEYQDFRNMLPPHSGYYNEEGDWHRS